MSSPDANDPDALDMEALLLQARAAVIRIKAELAPVLAERLTAGVLAELAARSAEARVTAPAEEAARIAAELTAVAERGALASAAVSSADVTARLDARVRAAACAEESEHLSALLRDAAARAAAARSEAAAARREAGRTAALSDEAAGAIENPLSSPLGEDTAAYAAFMVRSGMWMSDPRSPVARQLVTEMLGPSGVGAQLQRDAISAYLAGDPAALAAGGTDRLPDGRTVTHRPGRPPLVSQPRLSGDQAAAAMSAVPQVPGDALSRARSAASDVIS